jgi:predicted PurR-regulated permease PerM
LGLVAGVKAGGIAGGLFAVPLIVVLAVLIEELRPPGHPGDAREENDASLVQRP